MNVGLFLIHVVVGLVIAAHGSQKLFGVFDGHGPEGTGRFMEALGLRPGKHHAIAAGTTELVGGLLLATGLFVPGAAALICATYLVAARTAHAGKGPWNSNEGWEYPVVLSTVALGLAFNGAGKWSLDHAIGWNVSGLWWGIGAAVVAVIAGAAVLAGARVSPTSHRPRQTGGPAPGST
jgi:putative oxidoreductase